MRGRTARGVLACLGACLISAGAAGAASAAITEKSDFDASTDGWTVQGDIATAATHVPTGGNPSGYVSAIDSAVGGVMYWVAPSKFLGNQANKYGGRLTFDLRQSATDSQFDTEDVRLAGAGLTLVGDIVAPTSAFSHYVLPLRPANWVKSGTATPPTGAELKAVLGAVTSLQIRAEYRTGDDTDDLDNVVLTRCSIVGTAFNDILPGTGNDDTACGLGGDDQLTGRDGNDTLYGDEGNDTIFGQGGDDRLFGGLGNDALNGGPDADSIFGQGGTDTCVSAANDAEVTGCEL